ncbi:hypothetical protein J057_24525 [Marinobacter nanhaiticus D15-8W]|uniref:SWIM-type domain-containing protein n=1 Tax=Marinobacter nanhaiticus D15-8W TaxID=626887 RepID=A0A371CG70_9GAMM|nr:hypothetical protein J057_24525 [Marinobacter nanhaiticus D15-8W]
MENYRKGLSAKLRSTSTQLSPQCCSCLEFNAHKYPCKRK